LLNVSPLESMKKCIRAKVHGRVQGVGFRYFTKQAAQKYDISGYAKNEPDRTVLIIAEGEEQELDRFIAMCRQGPSFGRVDKMETTDEPLKDFNGFIIK